MGLHSEEAQKMGERVTYYQAASDSLVVAGKFNKKLDKLRKNVSDALAYCSDVINGKLINDKLSHNWKWSRYVMLLKESQSIIT